MKKVFKKRLFVFFFRYSNSLKSNRSELPSKSALSRSIPKSLNPFEDEYDDTKNPFNDEDDADFKNPFREDLDCDKNLNPFA